MAILWEVLVVLLLILLNGTFAMSELALVSAKRPRLQALAARRRGARTALALMADPGRLLSTAQVGITLIGILAGAYSGATLAAALAAWLGGIPGLAGHAESLAIALVVLAITGLTLIFGELVPKRIALVHAESIAIAVAGPMRALATAGAPIVWLLSRSTEAVLWLTGIRRRSIAAVTEDEIRNLIAEGKEAGVIAPAEQRMIEGVMRSAERTVRAIMTPRYSVDWLDLSEGPERIAACLAGATHSRLPVGRGALDELVGVIRTKDVLGQVLRGAPIDLHACLAPPLVVHDGMPVLRLIELFRRSPGALAVVADEYGSVEGIVTPADILTALDGLLAGVDGGETGPAARRDDGSWLVDGAAAIDEVAALIGLSGMREGDYETLAGFVLWHLGHLPRPAEHFTWNGVHFEVVDMDRRRIDKVLIRPPRPRGRNCKDGTPG